MKIYSACVLFMAILHLSQGALKRCYKCRSRGELGDCKDPFVGPNSESEVEEAPCSSGWCAKVVEGIGNFKSDEYGLATERLCLQRAPSDGLERCAKVTRRRNEQVLMCFCQGDLCNASSGLSASFFTIAALFVLRYFM